MDHGCSDIGMPGDSDLAALLPNGAAKTSALALNLKVGSDTVVRDEAGARTWTPLPTGTAQDLDGISCPSAHMCVAVGDFGTILRSGDGGLTWTTQPQVSTTPTPFPALTAQVSTTAWLLARSPVSSCAAETAASPGPNRR